MVHAGHRRVVHARHRAVIHARGGRRAGLAHARHRAMIHAGHAAAHVMGHAHVHHGQQLDRVQRRHVGLHAGARRQRGARVAGAVHGLREDGVGAVLGRFDDHVVGLGHGDAELVDLHRPHVLAVGGHHGHFQAGDTHVEVAHRRTVDEAQPHALAGLEQAGPVAGRRGAVGQEGVGGAGNIRQVGRRHAHLFPHQPFRQGRAPALGFGLARQALHAGTDAVVVVRLHHQLAEHAHRIFVGPVGQQHHVLAVEGDRVAPARLDDDGAVQAGLFLEAGVAVIPVGAALAHVETVGVGLAGIDARKAQARHAVHVGGQQDAVPVDGALLVQPVGDVQRDRVALAPAQQRRGNLAVHRGADAGRAREIDRRFADFQMEFGAAQFGRLSRGLRQRRAPAAQRRQRRRRPGLERSAGVRWEGVCLSFSHPRCRAKSAAQEQGLPQWDAAWRSDSRPRHRCHEAQAPLRTPPSRAGQHGSGSACPWLRPLRKRVALR